MLAVAGCGDVHRVDTPHPPKPSPTSTTSTTPSTQISTAVAVAGCVDATGHRFLTSPDTIARVHYRCIVAP